MIHTLENINNGNYAARGCIYFTDKSNRKKWYDKLSKEHKKEEDHFILEEVPKRLSELKEKLKKYEMD